MNSNRKGKRGEREFAEALRALGFNARRGQQFAGSQESPDVVCEELKGRVHFEVKRTETFQIHKAVAQAREDAGSLPPVVATRRNHGEWLLVVPLAAFPQVCQRFLEGYLEANRTQTQPDPHPHHD